MDSGFSDALGAPARLDASTPSAVLRDGNRWIVATEPVDVVSVSGDTAFDVLDALEPGFWAGFLAFELGHAVERVCTRSTVVDGDTRLPDLVLVRFARRRFAPVIAAGSSHAGRVADPSVGLGVRAWTTLDHDDYTAGVEVVLDHVRAGDCYQVNLTRTIGWERPADPMALFRALTLRNPARHSALLRLPVGAGTVNVVSASPERFLAWHGTHIETRPIKGTASDAAVLERSGKDHAENVMIVDLARNDFGRVCEPGSIDVPALCATETHPGLVHLVSTVRGVVRPDVGLGQVVRATFPPASVTGAPKPRVLQIIEDLEPTRRGVYCGAVGWLDTERCRGDLAVAIRTFVIEPQRTTLGVGSGIVADSIPALEWDETRLKARRLLAVAGASEPQRVAVTDVSPGERDARRPDVLVWFNGELVEVDVARVSPMDHGLLTGDGVFETLRVYDSHPFSWDRHVERLEHSAAALGLAVPNRDELRAAADAVITANRLADGRLRITLTGGDAPLGSERGDTPPTLIIATGALRVFPLVAAVVTVPWTRNERSATAGLKTISYAENVRALAYANEHGASEAIFANTRGELCEAAGSNVFVVSGGVVHTPPMDSGCLLGVTRAHVIELCDREGIPCEQVAVPMHALPHADEAFLTSSTREVQPIASIDGVALRAAPGPITDRLRNAFRALVEDARPRRPRR